MSRRFMRIRLLGNSNFWIHKKAQNNVYRINYLDRYCGTSAFQKSSGTGDHAALIRGAARSAISACEYTRGHDRTNSFDDDAGCRRFRAVFRVQALSVSYATRPLTRRLIGKLIVVSVALIGVTLLAVYGLGKVNSHATVVTTLRYLLIGIVAPLLAIQLWIGTSLRKAFAPQSVFVYALGFLIFAVAPYFLIIKTIQTERAWLELSILV